MPIPFFSIPEHIRNFVIPKFDFTDFLRFHESSRESYETARNVKTKFLVSGKHPDDMILLKRSNGIIMARFKNSRTYSTADFLDYPLRFKGYSVITMGSFTDEYCVSLTNLLVESNSSIRQVLFFDAICSAEALNRLNESRRAIEIQICGLELKESDILTLKMSFFSLRSSNITNKGINLFLKQFIEGKRDIFSCQFFIQGPQKEVILEGIPHKNVASANAGKEEFSIGSGETHVVEIDAEKVIIKEKKAK